jgi:hypothetical protein
LGTECVTSSFAYTGRQYLIVHWLQPIASCIAHDVEAQMIDATLMLISWMGQGAYLSEF